MGEVRKGQTVSEPESDTYEDIMTITEQGKDNETVNQVNQNDPENSLTFKLTVKLPAV